MKSRRIRDVNKKKEKTDAQVSYNVNPLSCLYLYQCRLIALGWVVSIDLIDFVFLQLNQLGRIEIAKFKRYM